MKKRKKTFYAYLSSKCTYNMYDFFPFILWQFINLLPAFSVIRAQQKICMIFNKTRLEKEFQLSMLSNAEG